MIDTELVKKAVALMGGFDDAEVEKYNQFIIASSLSISEFINDDADENDARIIQLAAAKAYNSICCIAENADGITSFTAGEITVKQESNLKDFAEKVLNSAYKDCKQLLKSDFELDDKNGFAFLGV